MRLTHFRWVSLNSQVLEALHKPPFNPDCLFKKQLLNNRLLHLQLDGRVP